MSESRIVIVGASLTGSSAVQALRDAGCEDEVVLVGAEPDLPYERPPLSKEYLRGALPEVKLYLKPEEWYRQQKVEVRLGTRASHLDPSAREVQLDNGESLSYAKLLIATGCQVRRLSLPGADLDGVCYLRDRAQAKELADRLARAQNIVVVGAGFIGLEVAASARMLGHEVTVLERGPAPLQRVLGPQVGHALESLHRQQGVDLRLSCSIEGLAGKDRLQEILLSTGERLPCDLAIVGIGVLPSTGWLEGSGIEMDNGVLVDEYTQTNLSEVYAAGDLANFWNPLMEERMRLEHFENAQGQGLASGKVMAGIHEPYAPVPYFWSDQFDQTLQYAGYARPSDEVILRGDLDSQAFTAFYLRDGQLRAAFGLGRPRDITGAQRLLQNRVHASASQLADESLDLRKLARQKA